MQDNKIKIIIIILVILIFIVGIGGTALYFTTDLLKPNQLLFQKYMAQNIENFMEAYDLSKEEENIDLLGSINYNANTEATLKYLEKETDEEEVYKIKETGISKAQEQASYRNITASYGNDVIMSVDLLGQNNIYGFRLSNLVQQFVSAKNATVSYFVSSMGLDGSMFSEKLQGVAVTGLLDFSDDEIQELIKTYVNLMLTDIDKSHYTAKKNTVVTLTNKESVDTTAYTLNLTKNELDKLYRKILNQALNDKIILGKIENVDSKIKEAGLVEKEGESLKERYTSKIQEKIDGLEYQGEDNSKITITVYVQKGTTVRTVLKSDSEEYLLDLDNREGKVLDYKETKLVDQQEEVRTYKLGKIENDQGRKRIIGFSNPEESLEATLNTSQSNEGMTFDITGNYKSKEISNIDLTSKTDIKLSADEALPMNFDETNNILLSDYEGGKALSILYNLKNRAIQSLENTQSVLNTKMLNKIILKIDEKEQKKQQEQQDNMELQKEKFNNKFVLYEGEDVEKEYVKKLIKTAGENMTDYQVVNGKQLKLFIKEGEKNEAKANEIATAIEDSNDTYNIKLNYNEAGYVDTIDIIVCEKN